MLAMHCSVITQSADCETFRASSLMSKMTIHMPYNEGRCEPTGLSATWVYIHEHSSQRPCIAVEQNTVWSDGENANFASGVTYSRQ